MSFQTDVPHIFLPSERQMSQLTENKPAEIW